MFSSSKDLIKEQLRNFDLVKSIPKLGKKLRKSFDPNIVRESIDLLDSILFPASPEVWHMYINTVTWVAYLSDDTIGASEGAISACFIDRNALLRVTRCLTRLLYHHRQMIEMKIKYIDFTCFEKSDIYEADLPVVAGALVAGLLSIAINITDFWPSGRKVTFSGQLLEQIFNEMMPQFHDIDWEKGTLQEKLFGICLDITYNCAREPSNASFFEEHKVVENWLRLKDEVAEASDSDYALTILLTLSYLSTEKNNDVIVSDTGVITTLLNLMAESLTNQYHTCCGYHVDELADGLAQIAVNDKNKVLIWEAKGIDVLVSVLDAAADDKERIAVLNALWLMSFNDEAKKAIKDNEMIAEHVREFQRARNSSLKWVSQGLLWQVGDHDEVHSKGTEGTELYHLASRKHIMISYQWDNQPVVKQIRNDLRENGYNVWLDIDNISGSILEAMAKAVEESEVVLVCVSPKYKQSPNCRAEAEYAFAKKKIIMPLMMENGYHPDGWLGIILGSKLWIDFSSNASFDNSITKLNHNLADQCKESRIQEEYVKPIEEVKQRAETQPDDAVHSTKPSLSSWDNSQVCSWLQAIDLKSEINPPTVYRLTGVHLLMLMKLKQECPKLYYNCLRTEFGLTDTLDALKFTYYLEGISQGN